jgi:hypothetical protein
MLEKRLLGKLLSIVFTILFITACAPKFDEAYYRQNEVLDNIRQLSKELQSHSIVQIDDMKNDVIILNSIIIDFKNMTYGSAPQGGFVQQYLESASSIEFSSWDELANKYPEQVNISFETLSRYLNSLNSYGFKQYYYDADKSAHWFQTGSSVMHGFEGVLVTNTSTELINQYLVNYDTFTQISSDVYYFELR